MPYSVSQVAGRYVVTSPKGKTWKTDYPSQPAAEKAIAYIEGRFSSAPPSRTVPPPSEVADNDPDTSKERELLGIPPKDREEDDTEGW